MAITVRQARLDDTRDICALFRARIGRWQRLDARGQVEDVDYESLSIYERWLHGGAWMSIETGAIQLSQLLRGAGEALVAEDGGRPLGYCEVYRGQEPPPFGDHLHLAQLAVADSPQMDMLAAALVETLLGRVRALRLQHLTADSVTLPDPAVVGCQALPLATVARFEIAPRTGQIFYQAVDYEDDDYAHIAGWAMPVGRLTSARAQWETLWPRTFAALPEISARRTHRLRFTAAGQEALVCAQQQLYDPRSADIYLWTPKALTGQMVSALRDWAHREGYRKLVLTLADEALKALGSDGEATGFTQTVCALTK